MVIPVNDSNSSSRTKNSVRLFKQAHGTLDVQDIEKAELSTPIRIPVRSREQRNLAALR